MITVTMEYAKWQQILNIVGNTRDFPWTITNPLLLELGKQIEPQQGPRGNSHADSVTDLEQKRSN